MLGLTGAHEGALAGALEAFDRRLSFGEDRPLALALSGGGDSLALLSLAADWARRRARPLLALTVDHGLQSESQAFTAFAGAASARLGVPWRALYWRGPKPDRGLPAAARAARHRLLAAAARDAGARVLVLGHTADDRREEGLMRLETPALGRLREWAPSPAWPEGRDLFLLRPLLAVRRASLRARLRALGLDCLEDPANLDQTFLRARARAALAEGPWSAPPPLADGDPPPLAAAVQGGREGQLTLPAPLVFGAEGARLAAMALACVSGRETPPRGRTVARALARLAAAEDGRRIEVGGAAIVVKDGWATFARDPAAQRRAGAPRLNLPLGGQGVFDGRFEIAAEAPLEIAPLYGRIKRLAPGDRSRLAAMAPYLRAALPAALVPDGGVGLPAPWGAGAARAVALAGGRFAAAAGLVRHERDILRRVMARGPLSSYLHP